MINDKSEECVYFRSVRHYLNKAEEYLRKCPDGICKVDGVYFTTSLREAITEWSREELDKDGWYNGKVIIYRPSPGATAYRPPFDYTRKRDEYKKYRNTRVIKEDKYLHEGCIKGEITYKYKCGCEKESFCIEIYRDVKNKIKIRVKAEFVERDAHVKMKLARKIVEELTRSKIYQEFYNEVRKIAPPKLKECETRI